MLEYSALCELFWKLEKKFESPEPEMLGYWCEHLCEIGQCKIYGSDSATIYSNTEKFEN